MDYYNTERLHSAIGYIAPKDKLDGRAEAIWAERDRKLAEARERRRVMRRQQRDRQKIEGKELTFRKEGKTISLAGQTEAGSAGAQPARDSRLGLRQPVESGAPYADDFPGSQPHPTGWRSSPMPQKIHATNTAKRPIVGQDIRLAQHPECPIHAEPLQDQSVGRETGSAGEAGKTPFITYSGNSPNQN